MATNKTTRQPGSEQSQEQAHDTGKDRPSMEQSMSDQHKSKQGPEDDHTTEKTKRELQEERGGHGHSGHSSNRSGSESGK